MLKPYKLVAKALRQADRMSHHGVTASKLNNKQTNQLFKDAKRKQERENV